MKKQWIRASFIFLSLLPVFGLFLQAEENSFLKSVEKSHQLGEYSKFLKSLDDEYKKAGKAGMLSSVFAEMKKWNASKEEELFQDFRVKEICSGQTDADICKKIDSIASLSLTDKQMEAVKFFNSMKNKMPDKDLHLPENKLGAIQAEFDLKMSLLRLALARKDKNATLDSKKKIALTLEKFKKMEEAAAKFEDSKWKTLIQDAKEAFMHSYEARSEYAYLKDLASGKVAPKSETEEKIKGLVQNFLAKADEK